MPVLVFVVWRLAHAAVLAASGGRTTPATTAFDGQYYLSLLRDGYRRPPGGYDEFSNVAFFPALAWVTDAVRLVVRDETAAVLVVANGCALAAFVAVWGACRVWTTTPTAHRAVVALALVPSSYYLWMYYTEALLLATAAGAAWASARNRPLLVLPLLVLAGAARTVGVVVGPCLAVARVVRLRRVDAVAVGYVAASLAGLAAVALRQQVELGDPWAWTRAQEAWGRALAPPWEPFVAAVRLVAGPGAQEGVALDLVVAVGLGVAVAVLGGLWRRGVVPAEAFLLAGATWAVPLLSTLLSSQLRFALAVWPVLLLPALWWPRLPWVVRLPVLVAVVGLTVVLLGRLADGRFTA